MLLWPDGKSRTSEDDEHCEADADYLQHQLSQMWDDGGSWGITRPHEPPLFLQREGRWVRTLFIGYGAMADIPAIAPTHCATRGVSGASPVPPPIVDGCGGSPAPAPPRPCGLCVPRRPARPVLAVTRCGMWAAWLLRLVCAIPP